MIHSVESLILVFLAMQGIVSRNLFARETVEKVGLSFGRDLKCPSRETGSAPLGFEGPVGTLRRQRRHDQDPPRPTHQTPVVFVSGAAQEADLIVTAGGIQPRPGEAVRAGAFEQSSQKCHTRAAWWRPLQLSSQR